MQRGSAQNFRETLFYPNAKLRQRRCQPAHRRDPDRSRLRGPGPHAHRTPAGRQRAFHVQRCAVAHVDAASRGQGHGRVCAHKVKRSELWFLPAAFGADRHDVKMRPQIKLVQKSMQAMIEIRQNGGGPNCPPPRRHQRHCFGGARRGLPAVSRRKGPEHLLECQLEGRRAVVGCARIHGAVDDLPALYVLW